MNRIEALLDKCNDLDGGLQEPTKRLFRDYFYGPSPQTWHAIHNTVFAWWGSAGSPKTPWNVLTVRFPHYYECKKPRARGPSSWLSVPDVFTVYRVMTDVTKGLVLPKLFDKP